MKCNLSWFRAGLAMLAVVALVAVALPAPALAANDLPGQMASASVYASGSDCVHTVGFGETLTRIATRYGTTVPSLARLNFLFNPNLIFAGSLLRVPCAPVSNPQPCVSAIYVVQPGDDLFRIGLRFGLNTFVLASFNDITNPNLIFAGMPLAIPCSNNSGTGYTMTPVYPTPNPAASPTPTPSPSAGQVTVVMQNLAFNPSSVTVHAGQMVVWRNNDSAPHTTTSGSCSGSICTPMAGWDSGILNSGQSFSHTFTSTGTFTYYCRVHGAMMQGTVVVIP